MSRRKCVSEHLLIPGPPIKGTHIQAVGHFSTMSETQVPNSVQQRIIIKFLNAENVTPTEIYERLLAQFGEVRLSRARVFSWCKEFKDGRGRVEN